MQDVDWVRAASCHFHIFAIKSSYETNVETSVETT